MRKCIFVRDQISVNSGWLSIQDLSILTGWSYEAIRTKIRRGKFRYIRKIRVKNKGARNGKVWQIHIEDPTIPEEARMKYWQIQDVGETVDGDQSMGVLPTTNPIVRLKLEAVRRFISLREVHRGRDLVSVIEYELIPQFRQRGLRISVKSLYRWVKEYEERGEDAFIVKKRERGVVAFDEKALRYAFGLYLRKDNLSAKACYELLKVKAKENGWRIGSYASFCRALKRIPDGVKVLARQGERVYRANFLPKIHRRYDDIRPNDIWVLDHTALNIMVWEDDRRERVIRPWITAGMDLRTRMIVGFVVIDRPSGDSIALMLRRGMLPKEASILQGYKELEEDFYWPIYGVPMELYFDNGKDFRSGRFWEYHRKRGWRSRELEYRVVFDDERRGALEVLGIQPRLAIPYNAWSKQIERWFRELKRYIQTLPGGWVNRKNMSDQDRGRVRDAIKKGELLTLRELQAILEYWVVYEYHTKPHAGLPKRNGEHLSPLRLFEELKGEIVFQTVSARALDFLLMKHASKKVFKDGIHLNGLRYQSMELAPYIGRTVQVYYDPLDISEVYVYARGKYVCTAISPEGLSMKKALGKIRERDLKSALREQRKIEKRNRELIRFYTEGVELPSPLERILLLKKRMRKQKGNIQSVDITTGIERMIEEKERKVPLEEVLVGEDDIVIWEADLHEKD